MYKKYFKSILDFLTALLALTIFSGIMFLITVALYLVNHGQPFFYQDRAGKNGHVFKIFKFKTMSDKRDINGVYLSDELRLTKIGRFLRLTSMDELPQLINIIKGDMSIIGPRPLLVEYLSLYSESHARRHEVKPGLTGWAQINGRQNITLSKRRDYDIWYVDNLSFKIDTIIFYKTILRVFSGDGVKSGQKMEIVDDLDFGKRLKEKKDEL